MEKVIILFYINDKKLTILHRTKYIVYSFFNNLTITFNVPPILVNSEVRIELPCTGKEWSASTPQALAECRKHLPTHTAHFQEAFSSLLSQNSADEVNCSSFGLYILIHAILQQIWHIRQASLSRDAPELTALEPALKKWQNAWTANSESSLSPHNPHGPLAFNSSTLLRLAYVRLSADLGEVNSTVASQSVSAIAKSMNEHSGGIRRSNSRTMTALHAIHALRVPVKIGLNQVARTGMLVWSLQHYLYSFECSKFGVPVIDKFCRFNTN